MSRVITKPYPGVIVKHRIESYAVLRKMWEAEVSARAVAGVGVAGLRERFMARQQPKRKKTFTKSPKMRMGVVSSRRYRSFKIW